jgi:LPS sulfotransferase NodH
MTLVTASHRTGTNLLCKTLNERDDVKNLMEIFNRSLKQAWRAEILKKRFQVGDFPFYAQSSLKNHVHIPGPMAGRSYFEGIMEYSWSEPYVILKILFQQCPLYYDLWNDILRKYEDALKIIYLKRTNLWHVCVSFFRAKYYQNFCNPIQYPLSSEVLQPIELNPELILHHFLYIEQHELFFNIVFSKRKNVLWLDYDEMMTNWSDTLVAVEDFIGLPHQDIPQQTLKQITIPHNEIVGNYDEVKDWFRGTKWEHYFE